MIATFTTLLAALLGGCLTIAGSALQRRNDHRVRKEQLLRERGEELYEITIRWINDLSSYAIRRMGVLQGKLTYNQCLDMDIAAGAKTDQRRVRIELLIDVYFPSARDYYDRLIASRGKLHEIEAPFKARYELDGPFVALDELHVYVKRAEELDEAGKSLLKEIKNCVRKVG